jgi:ATP-binding cassette subfamily B protein RaxB
MYLPIKHRTNESIANAAIQDSNLMESIRGVRSIKVFGRESDRESLWNNKLSDSINSEIKVGKLQISYELIHGSLSGCSQVLVVFIGANLVLDGSLSIGMLYAFMAYQRHFTNAMTSLVDQFINYLMIQLHLERLSDIALTPQEQGLENQSTFSIPIEGSIRLKDAGFRYSSMDAPVIDKFNLDIEPGEIIAIYGPSGSGKSTIMNLLSGLEQATEGGLYVNQQPLHQFGIFSYRANIAAVLQGDSLMTGTVKENICFNDTSCDEQALLQASNLAEIHQEVQSMSMGYNSMIGDMGTALSMGQQQRILIARALYTQPRILFMDEGTAHLDTNTENRVMDNITKLGISCVFISHNQSLLKYADKVVHLAANRIRVHHLRKPEVAASSQV